jgi:PAS domain S-box-containing protein
MGALPELDLPIRVADRTWRLQLTATPSFVQAQLDPDAPWILPIGLVLTGLLALLTQVLMLGKQGAETMVRERTMELEASLLKLAANQDDLRLLLDSTAEAIYGIDVHGACTFCNRALLVAVGANDQEEVLGRNMHDLIHYHRADGSVLPVGECRIFHSFQDQVKSHVDDEVFWTLAGVPFPVEYWSYPQFRNGLAIGAVVTFMDISQRKEAEDKIKESEARREAARRLSSLTGGFLQMGHDTERNLQIFVDQLQEHLGASTVRYFVGGPGHWRSKVTAPALKPDLGDQANLDLLPPAGSRTGELEWTGTPPSRVLFCPVAAQGIEFGVMAALRSDGVAWTPEDHTVIEVLSAATGIEEARAAAERESRTVLARLHNAQKLESVGRLAAGVAHEINTPIQFLSVNLRFLQKTYAQILVGQDPATGDSAWIEEEIPKVLEDSLEGINRVAKIVRAMKEFSHPGTLEPVGVDINRCLDSAATVSRNEWKYVAELELDLAPELGLIPGFPAELNQVFLNLIINAAQAIAAREPKGEALGTIRISSLLKDGWVEIRVADNGIGIAEEHKDKVYEPFFTTKAIGIGTGQGLAASYQTVVVDHRGELSFTSQPGVGTTFLIRLPGPDAHLIGGLA